MNHSPASTFAHALVDALIAHGLRHMVVAPGSRSQALALAAAQAEAEGRLTLHVRTDERVAGFLALGIALESRTPIAVVVTSGTAVANLHPAVLEAHQSGVPLLLLTADRPPEMRGLGANQTADQVGIFGTAVEWAPDVAAPADEERTEALVARAAQIATTAFGHLTVGPVQLNLAFREPLSGTADPDRSPPPVDAASVPPEPTRLTLDHRPGTIVVAGTQAGSVAEAVARSLDVPLIAEVASGAHFGPNLVVAYRPLLADADFGGAVRRVIVYGHPTLSREVPALIQREGVETIVVRSPGADAYNPGRAVSAIVDEIHVSAAATDSREARAWVGRWVHTSRAVLEPPARDVDAAATESDPRAQSRFARAELALSRQAVDRQHLVESVWRLTWPHDRLLFGSSRLIRVADAVVPGKRIPAFANRGLAGIDGTVATGIGIALASQQATDDGGATHGTTRVLLGDLALLHDVGALQLPPGEQRPRIQVIVGNDGGGTIFDSLEVAASADPTQFDRVVYTPQAVDLSALATAYGWEYRQATSRGELEQVLSAGATGPVLIEVPLAR